MIASTILMVRPAAFGYNAETATNNYFQSIPQVDSTLLQQKALEEFDNMVALLRSHGVKVLVVEDSREPPKPDAIFPNNWFSVQRIRDQLTLILYPMLNLNRRAERQKNALLELFNAHQIKIDKIIDLTYFESENKALEGTGSVVFDHERKKLYVSLSKRSHIDVLQKLVEEIQYEPITFKSYDKNDQEIYHTNVMMSIGKDFAIICRESIKDPIEQHKVIQSFTNKKLIEISSI